MTPAKTPTRPGLPALLVLLFALPLALYLRAVFFGFVNYDDVDFVKNNPVVHGLTPDHLVRLFTYYIRNVFYPVCFLTFALDFSAWGGASAMGYHVTNLALHLANVWLVYLLSRKWAVLGLKWAFSDPKRSFLAPEKTASAGRLALAAGVLFAVHPAAVEPVGWILGRKELLTVFFTLLALLAHERATRPKSPATLVFHVLSAYAALAAALSHVTAMTLPLAAVLYHWFLLGNRRPTRILLATSYLWAAAALTLSLRLVSLLSWNLDSFTVMHPHLPTAIAHLPEMIRNYLAHGGQGHGAAGLAPWELALKYLQLPGDLVFPVFWRGLEVTDPAELTNTGRLALSAAALAGLSALLFRLRKDRVFLFGALWCLAALAPALVLHKSPIPPSRFFYLPMAGLSLAGGSLFLAAARARPGLARAVFAVILSAYAALGAVHLGEYRDGLAFHGHNARAFPDFWKARQALGLEYVRLGRPEEAAVELYAAARLAPDEDRPWTDLVVLGMREKGWDRTLAWAREAVARRPEDARRRAVLATALDRAGQGDEAMAEFSRALALNPRDPALQHAWGAALFRRGDLPGAILAFRASLAAYPGQARVHFNLARALEWAGYPEEARQHDLAARDLDPSLAAGAEPDAFSGSGP